MSGGRFDYNQYVMKTIAESIQDEIDKSGKPKEKSQLWYEESWYKKYPEDLINHKYSPEVIEKFKEAIYFLEKAYIYAHRVDWLLSGDDGEETFLKRLKEDLDEKIKSTKSP